MEEENTKQEKYFFVSYTGIDRVWDEWIAWPLEEAGYTTILQAWDFRIGSNFVSNMQHALIQAKWVVCVISPEYFTSGYAEGEWTAAEHLTGELGGLPLALDRAGAYIEEVKCSLSDYLSLYLEERSPLLQRRGTLSTAYLNSVATTWDISFRQVEQQNPAAADLLRACAFLLPDAIPEELLKEAGDKLGPHLAQEVSNPLRFQEMVSVALRYSFIASNQQAHTLSMHRLVQAVLQDRMKLTTQKQWAEQVVRLVSGASHKARRNRLPRTWQNWLNTYNEKIKSFSQVNAKNILF